MEEENFEGNIREDAISEEDIKDELGELGIASSEENIQRYQTLVKIGYKNPTRKLMSAYIESGISPDDEEQSEQFFRFYLSGDADMSVDRARYYSELRKTFTEVQELNSKEKEEINDIVNAETYIDREDENDAGEDKSKAALKTLLTVREFRRGHDLYKLSDSLNTFKDMLAQSKVLEKLTVNDSGDYLGYRRLQVCGQ